MAKKIKIKTKKAKGGGIDITVGCPYCKKPISKSTEFGMECEDECDRKNWEKENGRPFVIGDEIDNFFNKFGGMLGAHINSFNQPGQKDFDINELKDKFKRM